MTTYTHNGTIVTTTDAGYTAWINEVWDALEAVATNVPQTGEGTYPAVGLTRPATNTYGPWRVYRLPDTLHGSAPVYIKVELGSGGAQISPAMRVTVGTGINGSGTLTGVTTTAVTMHTANGTAPGAGAYETYATGGEGWLVLHFKSLSIGAARSMFAFAVYRSVDSDGAPTTEGVTLMRMGSALTATGLGHAEYLRFAGTNTLYSMGPYYGFVVGNRTASGGLGGQIEAFLHFNTQPLTVPVAFTCGVFNTEFPVGTVFQAALVGSTLRTYISAGAGCPGADVGNRLVHAHIWE